MRKKQMAAASAAGPERVLAAGHNVKARATRRNQEAADASHSYLIQKTYVLNMNSPLCKLSPLRHSRPTHNHFSRTHA